MPKLRVSSVVLGPSPSFSWFDKLCRRSFTLEHHSSNVSEEALVSDAGHLYQDAHVAPYCVRDEYGRLTRIRILEFGLLCAQEHQTSELREEKVCISTSGQTYYGEASQTPET